MAWVQEIYDKLYDDNTICVACISFGKDSIAMLRAIKLLGLPLHRIITTDVWATDTIPADLPPMWEWKKKADKIIKELYGIEVEHISAMQKEKFPVSEKRKAEVEEHATKDLSQFVQVERERATSQCSTQNCKVATTDKAYEDFLQLSVDGAKKSSMKKLTYQDIFYRRFHKHEGRDTPNIYGFANHRNKYCTGELKKLRLPQTRGEWCRSYLKTNIRISNFNQPRTMVPETQALFSKPR